MARSLLPFLALRATAARLLEELPLSRAALRLGHVVPPHDEAPPYQTHYFPQRFDHFKASPPSAPTWPQKYLVNDAHWGGPGAPILFYTGNEARIEAFYGVTGFVTDVLAPRLKALVVFAEQRFYGASLPFGVQSFSPESLELLTTEQVLADYAHLLTCLKARLNATQSLVVSFGGSYGGTLSTIFRAKYPHVVVGALAASAPLGYYSPSYWSERGVDQLTWFRTVERVYTEAAPAGCYRKLVEAVELANATSRTSGTRVAKAFGLCAPPTQSDSFVFWITEALESMPQVDYQPRSPVNATCHTIMRRAATGDEDALLDALATVTRSYYGLPPPSGGKCLPERLARNSQVDGGVPGDGPSPANSWGYQSCTETLHPFSTPVGAWRQYSFSKPAVDSLCARYYNTTPRLDWLETWSGGYAIADPASGHSNIIWSNGRRDPWHGGGFLEPSDALPGGAVIVMEHTAHHQDLRLPTSADPPELVDARKREEAIIRSWLGL